MNEIIINNSNGELTVSSVQVAKDFEKYHKDVIEKIENLVAENSATKSFYKISTHINRGKEYKAYEMTRDGFSLLVMGFTGAKALDWKLKYIQAFNEMEKQLRNPKPVKNNDDKTKELEIREMNAKIRMSNQLLKLANVDTLSEDWKKILVSKSAEVLTGEKLLPLPETEKTYSATEVGDMFGVSAQKIGKLANANNLKTPEYGKWYKDKSKYSSKEVDTFRYNEKAVAEFKKIFA